MHTHRSRHEHGFPPSDRSPQTAADRPAASGPWPSTRSARRAAVTGDHQGADPVPGPDLRFRRYSGPPRLPRCRGQRLSPRAYRDPDAARALEDPDAARALGGPALRHPPPDAAPALGDPRRRFCTQARGVRCRQRRRCPRRWDAGGDPDGQVRRGARRETRAGARKPGPAASCRATTARALVRATAECPKQPCSGTGTCRRAERGGREPARGGRTSPPAGRSSRVTPRSRRTGPAPRSGGALRGGSWRRGPRTRTLTSCPCGPPWSRTAGSRGSVTHVRGTTLAQRAREAGRDHRRRSHRARGRGPGARPPPRARLGARGVQRGARDHHRGGAGAAGRLRRAPGRGELPPAWGTGPLDGAPGW
ncbi:hypothetical protein QJS66_05120 [Kocuria rhizophila]|nr:hypothetical protein QJS66_05120 [Kocuria rhizophila]